MNVKNADINGMENRMQSVALLVKPTGGAKKKGRKNNHFRMRQRFQDDILRMSSTSFLVKPIVTKTMAAILRFS